MRTNIVIDEKLMAAAMEAGPFKTKKEAVEAGLKLLARQTVYRDLLALQGKLRWEDAPVAARKMVVNEPLAAYRGAPAKRKRGAAPTAGGRKK
jgi:Arc/MetJ family transcription regulator